MTHQDRPDKSEPARPTGKRFNSVAEMMARVAGEGWDAIAKLENELLEQREKVEKLVTAAEGLHDKLLPYNQNMGYIFHEQLKALSTALAEFKKPDSSR